MRLMRHFQFLLTLPILGVAFVTTPAFAQAIAIDKALVVVNEEAITLSEYQARHRQEVLQKASAVAPFDGTVNPQILDRMIDDRIQAQVAARRGIRVSRADVDQAVAFIAGQNNIAPAQLLAQLAEDGITRAQFRAGVREQQLIRRLVDGMVNARVSVSDQEVQNYLASHRELIDSDEAFEVSHLFIAIEGKSEEQVRAERENLAHIRAAVVAGRAFAQSAKEFSDGPKREDGGYLGWRKIGQLPQLFVDALRKTESGGVSEIIRSDNGLHLLHVHNRREGGQMVEQQQLRHIFVRIEQADDAAARELADELYARIQGGEDFAAIARAHSADKVSGIEGGRIGWVSRGDFPPAVEDALARLELNELSQPLRAPAGYHLVEVLDRRRVDVSFDLAAKRARQLIFQRKAASFYDNWYGAIRDAAHIEYVSFDPG